MILPGNESHTLPIIVYEEMQGTIHLKGRSISSEVDQYFDDFLPYLQENLVKNPMPVAITMEIEYFNTKTAKIFIKFFDIIKKYVVDKGLGYSVTWIVEEGDEDMREAAEDYEQLTRLKFTYVEKPE